MLVALLLRRSNAIVIVDSSDEINEEVIEDCGIISPCISHLQPPISSHKSATDEGEHKIDGVHICIIYLAVH